MIPSPAWFFWRFEMHGVVGVAGQSGRRPTKTVPGSVTPSPFQSNRPLPSCGGRVPVRVGNGSGEP